MFLEDASTTSQPESRSQVDLNSIEDMPADPSCRAGGTVNAVPFFPVTGKITFKPMTAAPERGAGHLPPSVARLVSLAGLGAVLLAPLSGCGSTSDVPCAVPTSSSGTSVSNGAPTARCTTSSGTHYVWIYNRGGWVQSDDGIHPRSNTNGVGVDNTHSGSGGADDTHGGVGDGHGGSGHGGGEGG